MKNWGQDRANSWHLFTPPARPSGGEVERYRAIVNCLKSNADSWLLLGSTPEVRSITGSNALSLIAIDQDKDVFVNLKRLVNPLGSESFIHGDWLSAPCGKVDVIIGDGALNMLHPSFHEAFFQRLHSLLSDNGHAVLRIHLSAPAAFANPQEVFRWYREEKPPGGLFTATRTHLDMLWMDQGSGMIDFEDYNNRIARLHTQGIVSQEEMSCYSRLFDVNKIKLFYIEKALLELLSNKWFDLLGTFRGGTIHAMTSILSSC